MRHADGKADKHVLQGCSRVEADDAMRMPKHWPSELHACSSGGQLLRKFDEGMPSIISPYAYLLIVSSSGYT